ncbi:MAG TPA: anti-sigma factor [candidate division Zixibacteria bacterium]|nr:anti-sigma factor [candidate division Zixibacteria bacterium]
MGEKEQQHIFEIIPAYALGSLDVGETEVASRHLAVCETCRAELVAYEEVVDALPLAASEFEPSPVLKERLMQRVSSASASDKGGVEPVASPESGSSWWQRVAEALRILINGPSWRPVALVFAVVLVVSNVLIWQQTNKPDPNSWRRIGLTGTVVAPDATGIIYISADGRNGTLIVDRLPQLGSENEYQLWLIEDGERSSGAIFSVDEDGYRGIQIESVEPLENFDSFGITIEPAGGSPGPTGERVLGYDLPD